MTGPEDAVPSAPVGPVPPARVPSVGQALVDPDVFRSVVGRLPAGVVVVAVRWRGTDYAMTASAVTSVSLEPPLLLVCLHVDGRMREAFEDADVWAVSVLSDTAGPVADWLSSPGRPAIGQLGRTPHRRAPRSGAAWIDDSAAWLECRTTAIHRAGDHDIVVGEVLEAVQGPAAAGGLVHLRGRVHPIT